MPSWSELYKSFKRYSQEESGVFLTEQTNQAIGGIVERSGRHVLYYASAFLQKPRVSGLSLGIINEDINGFVHGVRGHSEDKDLLLILHTPGGLAGAAQTIVEYLRSEFKKIDVAIPTYAMSAGTMIALGCDRIIMDHQSQMGPIDPQMALGGRYFSAHSIVGQFERAKQDILQNPSLAVLWSPVLRSIGPALLEEARRVLLYGKNNVEVWLERYMFANHENPSDLASKVADYFSSDEHGAHGKRIGRSEARDQKLVVENMEDDQILREHIMTLYYLSTIVFENSTAVKIVYSNERGMWIKNHPLHQQASQS